MLLPVPTRSETKPTTPEMSAAQSARWLTSSGHKSTIADRNEATLAKAVITPPTSEVQPTLSRPLQLFTAELMESPARASSKVLIMPSTTHSAISAGATGSVSPYSSSSVWALLFCGVTTSVALVTSLLCACSNSEGDSSDTSGNKCDRAEGAPEVVAVKEFGAASVASDPLAPAAAPKEASGSMERVAFGDVPVLAAAKAAAVRKRGTLGRLVETAASNPGANPTMAAPLASAALGGASTSAEGATEGAAEPGTLPASSEAKEAATPGSAATTAVSPTAVLDFAGVSAASTGPRRRSGSTYAMLLKPGSLSLPSSKSTHVSDMLDPKFAMSANKEMIVVKSSAQYALRFSRLPHLAAAPERKDPTAMKAERTPETDAVQPALSS
mmetsp:Transcript_13290/g.35627  ORF Transcript_13290/g.35627 Transcript_13290/m.35627 type:complete len:385 (-) Transcript_13290:461-1615(-)